MAARVQLTKQQFDDLHASKDTPGTIFNIWHLQESGGDTKKGPRNVKSPCSWTSKDSGTTSASHDRGVFCLWYARGMCIYGPRCYNLHCLPGSKHESDLNPALDCFGREKHSVYRDDMFGVGCFMYENCTLQVNSDDADAVKKRFSPFGRITVTAANGQSLVKFPLESQAQFAKEALSFQLLQKKNKKVMSIKWAAPNSEDDKTADERIQAALAARKAATSAAQPKSVPAAQSSTYPTKPTESTEPTPPTEPATAP